MEQLSSQQNESSLKQVSITCNGHTRPIVHLHFSPITENGFYLVSGSKGWSESKIFVHRILNFNCRWNANA